MAIANLVDSNNEESWSYRIPTSGSWYSSNVDLFGQYLVSCPNNIITSITLLRPTVPEAFPITYSTYGGTLLFTTDEISKFLISVSSGTNVPVLISKTAKVISTSTASLDQISSTGTYYTPGPQPSGGIGAFVLLVGGGGGGQPAPGGAPGPGGNGGSGGGLRLLQYSNLPTTGIPVVIGAPGPANTPGGVTYFSSYASDQYAGGTGGALPGTAGAGPAAGSDSPGAAVINPISIPYGITLGGGSSYLASGGASGRNGKVPPGPVLASAGAGGGGGTYGTSAPSTTVGGAGGDGRVWVIRFN